jgi:sugar phosphate isomerase/epimerase
MKLGFEAGANTIELASKYGVRGVPINGRDLVVDGVEETLKQISDQGLEVCQIGAFEYNALNPDQSFLEEKTRLLEQIIDLSPETGCSVIVIPGGNYHPSSFGGVDKRNFGIDAIKKVAEKLNPLVKRAESRGVVLSIEPYIKSVVHSPKAFTQLSELIDSPALRINLDITNFYGLMELIDPDPICRSFIPQMKGKVGLIHIKDIGLEDGFHIHAKMLPITEGPTNWKLVLEEASRIVEEDIWLILEHVATPEEAEKSLKYLRSIAVEVGIKFE